MQPPRIPFTVVGGFLGAGKTTLLNRLLRDAGGRRIAVLVNDFGAINIDAERVVSSRSDTIALANGCVCCSIGNDLSRALVAVLDAAPRFDAVVIEASGVSDPWRIAQIGLADPGFSLDGVIVLVDSDAVLDQARDPRLADSLERQLRGADLIVLNKADQVDAEHLRRVHGWVASVAGATPRRQAVFAELPAVLLGSPLHASAETTRSGVGGHDHGVEFESCSIRPTATFSTRALRRLVAQMPPGVLRMKGFVRTDEHGWSEVQFAGRHGSVRAAHARAGSEAALVAIGLRGELSVDALSRRLADCCDETSNHPPV